MRDRRGSSTVATHTYGTAGPLGVQTAEDSASTPGAKGFAVHETWARVPFSETTSCSPADVFSRRNVGDDVPAAAADRIRHTRQASALGCNLQGMYRRSDETPHCACCNSERLTPASRFEPSEGYARVHYRLKSPGPGFFDSRYAQFTVTRARICLSCGYVMHFVDETQLADLASRIAELEPDHDIST